MNLDSDLQRILNVNAKVYNVKSKRQGRVVSVSADLVIVDYGNKARPDTEEYDIDDFSQMLVTDEIVANSRLTIDSKDNFKIKPRMKSPITAAEVLSGRSINMTQDVKSTLTPEFDKSGPRKMIAPTDESELKQDSNQTPYEIGYINFTTGNFSKEPKKGYTKVEYRKVIEKVTLELTSEQVEVLKEMGLMK